MLCTVIKGPDFTQSRQQLAKATFAELRLDFFESITIDKINDLRKEFLIPMIFTLRSKQQGGNYSENENERIKAIQSLCVLEPEYIDLEYHVPESFISEIKKRHPNIKIIASYHNFEKMPPLGPILNELKKMPADFFKIAVTPQSSNESLEILDFMKNHSSNVFAMGMGPYGESTRVLGPLFGAKIIYGSPDHFPVKTLSEVYQIHRHGPQTVIYGLLGENVSKSLSHFSHNQVFSNLDLQCVYVKFPIKTDQLRDFLTLARRMNFKGLSVTMPLKEAVIPLIDEVHSSVGAVNTLKFENGKIIGYNTDGKGALDALEEKISVKGKKIVCIGAGGAAKGIVAEAIKRGAIVTILNRNGNRALELAKEMNCLGGSLKSLSEHPYDILINTTPSHMPIGSEGIIPGTIAMDITTQPQNTQFLHEAKKKGCILVFGYEMFVNQAVEQFKIWFDGKIDLIKTKAIIERTVLENIQKD